MNDRVCRSPTASASTSRTCPRPGRTDADRNCISNIHPPDGLGYAEAARVAAGLVGGAVALGRSGVGLKDTSRLELGAQPTVDGEIA